jgi:hypothetical protein
VYFATVPGLRCNNSGKVGAGLDIKAEGGYVLLPPSGHISGGQYHDDLLCPLFDTPLARMPAWLVALATAPTPTANGSGPEGGTDWAGLLAGAPEGQRHGVALRLAAHFLGKGLPAPEVEAIVLGFAARCVPPLDPEDARRIARDLAAKDAEPAPSRAGTALGTGARLPSELAGWPTLNPAALVGLAGRFVEAVAPHSEADRAAILIHLLVGVGNLIGPGPHARVEFDEHPPRLNAVVVGASSKGRKGTAWSTPRTALCAVDSGWAIASGLSTGEGLIYHVRDRVERADPETGEPVVEDEGVSDKRLMVVETEWSSVLTRIGREGNSLSAIMRDAWDHGSLRTLTKNSPLRATGAHISIVAHITQNELVRLLTSTEMANGFGNRILWICARRAQLLPHGGHLDQAGLAPLIEEIGAVVTAARSIRLMRRDPEAEEIWGALYPDLSRERDGLVGALLARAEAQVLRASVLYALLDRSRAIRAEHLMAALALWNYAEASVLHLFGSRLGHPIADVILDQLRQSGRLSRTQIRDLFARNKNADQIQEALAMLGRAGLAKRGSRDTGGRPEEYWEPA